MNQGRTAGQSDNEVAALIEIARECGARGWTPATSGNYSVRHTDGSIRITRSGADKRQLDSNGLMLLESDGTPRDDGKPSDEALLHVQIYQAVPDAHAVLHVHSPAATVLSRASAGRGAVVLRGFELAKAFPGVHGHAQPVEIRVVANDQDMRSLAASLESFLSSKEPLPVYLIEGHGIYAWGATVAHAFRHLEAAEFMMQCDLHERWIQQ